MRVEVARVHGTVSRRLDVVQRARLRRRTLRQWGRVRSYSLEDLIRNLEEKYGGQFGEKLVEDLEPSEPKVRRYDYADRQEAWPTGEDDSGYVYVRPPNIGPDPTQGPLERQVSTTLDEAMLSEEVDNDHMQYWFTKPPGGWDTAPRYVKKMDEFPGFFANARNPGRHRKSVTELKAGERFRGEVTEVWYHHGVRVDIGYDYDGLLPMRKEMWEEFKSTLDVGDSVQVIVAKLWNKDFYRWPIQLRAADPEIQKFMIPEGAWDPPVDLRGKTVEEIEKHTSRRLPTQTWVIPDDPEHVASPFYDQDNSTNQPDPVPFDQETLDQLMDDFADDMADVIVPAPGDPYRQFPKLRS